MVPVPVGLYTVPVILVRYEYRFYCTAVQRYRYYSTDLRTTAFYKGIYPDAVHEMLLLLRSRVRFLDSVAYTDIETLALLHYCCRVLCLGLNVD